MMGYYPLTHGEIRIDGRPLASLSHSALRRGIAMVQQDPVVLADTFYANVALGRDISEAQVWESLEAVQLAAVARSMSDGLYTQLGEQGNNLSVGQKQLLALARVLVDTPQVLILDEATANIDSGTEQAIQQALAKVRQHTTLVVIAHRLSTIVEADTIWFCIEVRLSSGAPISSCWRRKAATGRCISCSWPAKSWRPAPERSRSAPDAPPAGRERWAACDGAKTLHQMHRCGAFLRASAVAQDIA